MRTIHVTIRENKMVPDSVDAGHEMDNLVTQLSITIPSDWNAAYAYRLRFRTARQAIGEVYVSDRLTPNPSGDYVFPLPSGVLIEGLLHIQIEGTDTTTDKVMHTAVMVLTVGKSLRGDGDQGIPPNYSGLIDQTMSEMQATFDEMTNTLAHMDATLDEMDSTLVVDAESARQSAASAAADAQKTDADRSAVEQDKKAAESAKSGAEAAAAAALASKNAAAQSEEAVQASAAVVAEDRAAVEQVFAQATEDFRGPPGKDGADGAPGPNALDSNTVTVFTNLLKAVNGHIQSGQPGVDYATPSQLDDKLSKNGGVITGNFSGPDHVDVTGDANIGTPYPITDINTQSAHIGETITSSIGPGSSGQIDISGNFSGPGASGISRIGYPNQIGEVYALQAYLNGIEMRGNMLPDSNNVRNVGSANKRMAYVYGVNGNFSTQVSINGNAIIASGSSTNGRYVKFYDGTMICWGKKEWTSVSISAPWGSMYESTSYLAFSNFPSTFTAIPIVIISPAQGSSNSFYVEAVCNESASNPGSFYATRPGSATGCTVVASYIAIGRWK